MDKLFGLKPEEIERLTGIPQQPERPENPAEAELNRRMEAELKKDDLPPLDDELARNPHG